MPGSKRTFALACAAGLLAGAVMGCEAPEPPAHAIERSDIAPPEARAALLDAVAAHAEQGRHDEAEAIIRAAVAEYVSDAELRRVYADVLLRRAGRSAASGPPAARDDDRADDRERRQALALAQLEAIIDAGRAAYADWYWAGHLASRVGDPERAERYLLAAREADPTRAEAAVELAAVLLGSGRPGEAAAQLVLATETDPGRAAAWGMLAEASLRTNRPEPARRHAAKARSLEPDRPAWRLLEARALRRLGDSEGALLVLEPVPAPERSTEPYVRLRAECFALLGRPADAYRAYAHAVAESPRADADPAMHMQLAIWAERLGDLHAAARHAAKADRLGHQTAGTLLGSLRAKLNPDPVTDDAGPNPESDSNPDNQPNTGTPTATPEPAGRGPNR